MCNTIVEQGQKYQDARITVTGGSSIMPINPKVDDELSNYTLYLLVVAPNVALNATGSRTLRKIVSKEEITILADRFDAFVQEEDVFSTVNILGININATGKEKSWVVPGIGIVKETMPTKKVNQPEVIN